jgi:hypothetical protein
MMKGSTRDLSYPLDGIEALALLEVGIDELRN